MSKIEFPTRRGDQSFVVLASFIISEPEITVLVRDYVKAWMRANRTWTRIWRSNVIVEERLDFDSEFLMEPELKHTHGADTFSIVFAGRPTATRWKDWLVFLVDDLTKLFPEVKFEGFESRDA